jgi:hypothetical protein
MRAEIAATGFDHPVALSYSTAARELTCPLGTSDGCSFRVCRPFQAANFLGSLGHDSPRHTPVNGWRSTAKTQFTAHYSRSRETACSFPCVIPPEEPYMYLGKRKPVARAMKPRVRPATIRCSERRFSNRLNRLSKRLLTFESCLIYGTG